jgi:hypothetical protein
MNIRLLSEKNAEMIFDNYFSSIDESHPIRFKCSRGQLVYKNNFLYFRDSLFKRIIGVLYSEETDELFIFENAKKHNSNCSFLVLRYIRGSEDFLERAFSYLYRIYSNSGISKVKIVTSKSVIKDSYEALLSAEFKVEVSYPVGKDERIQLSRMLV